LSPYLDLFAQLGVWNRNIQEFISDYYRWKKNQPVESGRPVFFDFTSFEPLHKSEELFYELGVDHSQAMGLLRQHMANIQRLARFIAIYIYSVVLDDENLLSNKQLIETLRIDNLHFDSDIMRQECSCLDGSQDRKFARIGMSFIEQFRNSRVSDPTKASQKLESIRVAAATPLQSNQRPA
jgi:hypothetical protein